MPDEDRQKPTATEEETLRRSLSSQDYLTFVENKNGTCTDLEHNSLLLDLDEHSEGQSAPSSQQGPDDLFAVLVLLASCFLFTFMSCLVRYVIRFYHTPVLYISFYCGFATSLMCQVVLTAARQAVFATSSIRSTLLLHARCIFGALAIITSYAALQRLPVGIATCLNSMTPIITSIMGWLFLNEQLTTRNYIVLFIVTAGAVLVGVSEPIDLSNVSGSERVQGVFFCFLMAFSTACLYVSMRHLGSEANLIGTEFVSSIWCTILILILYGSQHGMRNTGTYLVESTSKLSAGAHLALIGVAFCNFLASILLNYSTRELRADKSAIVMTSEIPMGFVIAFLMMGEYPTSALEISGCILTAVGAYVIAVKRGG